MRTLPSLTELRARVVVRVARVVSGLFCGLGIVGLLRTTNDERIGDAPELTLLFLVVHPLSSLAYLAIGLVGVALASAPERARGYLLALSALLLAWTLAGAIARGRPNDALTGDLEVLLLYVVVAGISLAALLWPERERAVAAAPTEEKAR